MSEKWWNYTENPLAKFLNFKDLINGSKTWRFF